MVRIGNTSYLRVLESFPDTYCRYFLQNLNLDSVVSLLTHYLQLLLLYVYIHVYLLHIMCGYQCDKAVNKNDTCEVI